jgi:hypothetical protein
MASDIGSYEYVFGIPFFKREAYPTSVHAFVSNAIGTDKGIELQIELISDSSFQKASAQFEAERLRGRQKPAFSYESLETAFAIIEAKVENVLVLFDVGSVEKLEGSWRSFELMADAGSDTAMRLLSNLTDQEGELVGLGQSSETPSDVLSLIGANLGRVATSLDIENALQGVAHLGMSVAVLDVGQASSSFLYHESLYPRAYFDLGGPTWRDAGTFPSNGVRWCFSKKPPVILSHWHWDHWAGATYGGISNVDNALSATWICPDQKTGGCIRKLQSRILRIGGTILLWPSTPFIYSSNNLTLGQALGEKFNDSGLVLLLRSSVEGLSLLPGDAAYSCVPPAISSAYSNTGLRTLMISHHGGALGGSTTCPPPHPDGNGQNVAIYSAGNGNHYKHPTSLADLTTAGWTTIVGTDARNMGMPAWHLDAHTGGLGGRQVIEACSGKNCSLRLHR